MGFYKRICREWGGKRGDGAEGCVYESRGRTGAEGEIAGRCEALSNVLE